MGTRSPGWPPQVLLTFSFPGATSLAKSLSPLPPQFSSCVRCAGYFGAAPRCGSYFRDAPFVREASYSLTTVPNINQQPKKATVIVFPGPLENMPVPRWKSAASVAMFPSRTAKADRRNGFARVVRAVKTVFLWLRTGEVKRGEVAENLPARKRVAAQTTPGSRTAGH